MTSMAKEKLSDRINMPLTTLFAIFVTYQYPEYAFFAWLIFIGAGVLKILNL